MHNNMQEQVFLGDGGSNSMELKVEQSVVGEVLDVPRMCIPC